MPRVLAGCGQGAAWQQATRRREPWVGPSSPCACGPEWETYVVLGPGDLRSAAELNTQTPGGKLWVDVAEAEVGKTVGRLARSQDAPCCSLPASPSVASGARGVDQEPRVFLRFGSKGLVTPPSPQHQRDPDFAPVETRTPYLRVCGLAARWCHHGWVPGRGAPWGEGRAEVSGCRVQALVKPALCPRTGGTGRAERPCGPSLQGPSLVLLPPDPQASLWFREAQSPLDSPRTPERGEGPALGGPARGAGAGGSIVQGPGAWSRPYGVSGPSWRARAQIGGGASSQGRGPCSATVGPPGGPGPG